jgi:hypothetical protein
LREGGALPGEVLHETADHDDLGFHGRNVAREPGLTSRRSSCRAVRSSRGASRPG